MFIIQFQIKKFEGWIENLSNPAWEKYNALFVKKIKRDF